MVLTLNRFEFTRACLLLCAVASASAQAAEHRVPDDFGTIQGAINVAAAGDEVVIEPGTYTENLVINKSDIVVRGEETARTIVRSISGTVLQLTTVDNVTIRNLTFSDGNIGIEVVTNSTDVIIENNVFNLSTSATAIHVDASSEVDILHNTFHNNSIAIDRDDDEIIVKNNIFSSNDTAVTDGGIGNLNIAFNCFASGETVIGSGPPAGDPAFVDSDPGTLDFHLKSTSICIDAGDPGDPSDAVDGTDPDAGAYGGPSADTTPFPVGRPAADLNASTVNAGLFDVTLSWSENLAYLTTGYEIHYGSSQSGQYDGNDAEDAASGGATLTSPFTIGTVNNVTLFNLLSSPVIPGEPVLETPRPSNQTLDLRWSAVEGATGYRIEYGIDAVDEERVDVGNITDYELGGLENEQTYRVRVLALRQTRYYFALKAVGTPTSAKSALSSERAVAMGPAQAGAPSNELTGMPEPIEPYPLLPDKGEGCFIATAAYGHFSHPQVQLLRDFRDRYLQTNAPGQAFVHWYYRHSPPAAAFIAQHDLLRMLVRWILLPVIAAAWLLLHAPALTLALMLTILSLLFAAARMKSVGWKRVYVDS